MINLVSKCFVLVIFFGISTLSYGQGAAYREAIEIAQEIAEKICQKYRKTQYNNSEEISFDGGIHGGVNSKRLKSLFGIDVEVGADGSYVVKNMERSFYWDSTIKDPDALLRQEIECTQSNFQDLLREFKNNKRKDERLSFLEEEITNCESSISCENSGEARIRSELRCNRQGSNFDCLTERRDRILANSTSCWNTSQGSLKRAKQLCRSYQNEKESILAEL